MTTAKATRRADDGAFTLIELLVVIAIIGILAALIFPAAGAIKKSAIIKKTQTELDQVKSAIELYKEKLGTYPPDNPGKPAFNQLYYELLGTEPYRERGDFYRTLDQSAKIGVRDVSIAFAGGVNSFANSTKGSSDEARPARNFLKSLKPGQYVEGISSGVTNRILTCSVQWAKNLPSPVPGLVPNDAGILPNPWRYNSSNPTNSPGSYDLWVDVVIAGKTNRISNWSRQPQLVAAP